MTISALYDDCKSYIKLHLVRSRSHNCIHNYYWVNAHAKQLTWQKGNSLPTVVWAGHFWSMVDAILVIAKQICVEPFKYPAQTCMFYYMCFCIQSGKWKSNDQIRSPFAYGIHDSTWLFSIKFSVLCAQPNLPTEYNFGVQVYRWTPLQVSEVY